MKLFRKAAKTAKPPIPGEKIAVEKYIRDFLEETGRDYDWDDFISIRCTDPELEEIRRFCASTDCLFPPTEKGHWCNEDGINAMRAIQLRLKDEIEAERQA
jgi:hypothetical protein